MIIEDTIKKASDISAKVNICEASNFGKKMSPDFPNIHAIKAPIRVTVEYWSFKVPWLSLALLKTKSTTKENGFFIFFTEKEP